MQACRAATQTMNSIDWGRTRCEPAWREQEKLVARRIVGEISCTLVFVEHDAVSTIGMHSGAGQHLAWAPARLKSRFIKAAHPGAKPCPFSSNRSRPDLQ